MIKKKYKLNYKPWENESDENVRKVFLLIDEFVKKHNSKKIISIFFSQIPFSKFLFV